MNIPVQKSTEELQDDFNRARAALSSFDAERVMRGLPLDVVSENSAAVRTFRQAWSRLHEHMQYAA